MIQMVKGTYGRMSNGRVEAMTKHSGPFSLTKDREDELVKAGVAVKVDEQGKDYNRMKMADLRKAAVAAGVDAKKAKTVKSKKELIGLLEAAAKTGPAPDKE